MPNVLWVYATKQTAGWRKQKAESRLLRKDRDDDAARNDHDDPGDIKHDVAEPDGRHDLAYEPQGRVSEPVHAVDQDEHEALGSKVSLEHDDPVENEPRPEHISVEQECDLQREADREQNRHGLLSRYEERPRTGFVRELFLGPVHFNMFWAQKKDFARDSLDLATETHHEPAREVDEALRVILVHA